ncbi:hypothetical protein F4823DRAFT_90265 [Ustulina deusta]|nr:hypothetical protein F4823DRAFT_90265 [Ustulina deusta]
MSDFATEASTFVSEVMIDVLSDLVMDHFSIGNVEIAFRNIIERFNSYFLTLLSSLWSLFSWSFAISVLIHGEIMQSSIVGTVFPPEITSHEISFANAISLASYNNTSSNTLDFRVLIEGPEQMIKYVSVSSDVLPLGSRKGARSETAVVKVPALPGGDWNTADFGVAVNGKQITVSRTSCASLPSVENIWHPDSFEYLDLQTIPTPWSTKRVKLVTHPRLNTPGNKAVLKFAEFGHSIPGIDRETEIYKHLVGRGVAPQFIAHVTENRGARVIGFLAEYIEDARRIEKGSVSDLAVDKCKKALSNLHRLDIAHHDAHPSNCLIRGDGTAVLIDFEHARRGEADTQRDLALMDEATRTYVTNQSRLGVDAL